MANIVGVRIDERLIHGQVATAWTNKLNAERIMVIDNNIIKSSMDKMALKMACPPNCKLSVLSVEKAILNLLSNKYQDERIFIISKDPKYFLQLLENNVTYDKLVLGNLAGKGEAKMLRRSVYVNEEDIEVLNKICDHGVKVVLQMTPAEAGENYKDLIK